METQLDLSRWRERPRGVGYRRWSIVTTGLRLLFRTRFYRILLGFAWTCGLAIATLGFAFSQSLSTGGWLDTLTRSLGARMQAVFTALGGWVALYPDVCVGTVFTLIFWLHSFIALWLTLVALTGLIPRLISRDRASNALIVYLSRPLTNVDYLLGKLGIITAVILVLWTGPLVFGWLLSMLFAVNSDFVVHSLAPLGRALLFNAIALVALAAIALGVSAVSRTSRATISLWIGLWLVLGALATPPRGPVAIKRASFARDLNEVRHEVLRLDRALTSAATHLPLLSREFSESLTRGSRRAAPTDVNGSLFALGGMILVSSLVFTRKLRPES